MYMNIIQLSYLYSSNSLKVTYIKIVKERIMVGRFYVVVAQPMLLFESNTWVITPRLEKALKVFHHRVTRRMAGMGPKRQQYGTWVSPTIGVEMATVGLDEIWVYIARR